MQKILATLVLVLVSFGASAASFEKIVVPLIVYKAGVLYEDTLVVRAIEGAEPIVCFTGDMKVAKCTWKILATGEEFETLERISKPRAW